jgi:hypothetical protein
MAVLARLKGIDLHTEIASVSDLLLLLLCASPPLLPVVRRDLLAPALVEELVDLPHDNLLHAHNFVDRPLSPTRSALRLQLNHLPVRTGAGPPIRLRFRLRLGFGRRFGGNSPPVASPVTLGRQMGRPGLGIGPFREFVLLPDECRHQIAVIGGRTRPGRQQRFPIGIRPPIADLLHHGGLLFLPAVQRARPNERYVRPKAPVDPGARDADENPEL